jgi:hypothetical protein
MVAHTIPGSKRLEHPQHTHTEHLPTFPGHCQDNQPGCSAQPPGPYSCRWSAKSNYLDLKTRVMVLDHRLLARGQAWRPSNSLTMDQASALLAAAEGTRMHANVSLCLATGIRTDAGVLRREHVDSGDPHAKPPVPATLRHHVRELHPDMPMVMAEPSGLSLCGHAAGSLPGRDPPRVPVSVLLGEAEYQPVAGVGAVGSGAQRGCQALQHLGRCPGQLRAEG